MRRLARLARLANSLQDAAWSTMGFHPPTCEAHPTGRRMGQRRKTGRVRPKVFSTRGLNADGKYKVADGYCCASLPPPGQGQVQGTTRRKGHRRCSLTVPLLG
jgi:hypothetical protein